MPFKDGIYFVYSVSLLEKKKHISVNVTPVFANGSTLGVGGLLVSGKTDESVTTLESKAVKGLFSLWRNIRELMDVMEGIVLKLPDFYKGFFDIPEVQSAKEGFEKLVPPFDGFENIIQFTELSLKEVEKYDTLFSKLAKHIYTSTEPLSQKDEKKLSNLQLDPLELQGNLWHREYKEKLLAEILEAYKTKVGIPFFAHTACTGINDELDKKMLSYVTLLFNKEDATVNDIESILHNFYYKKKMLLTAEEIKKVNEMQEMRAKKSKGKLISYGIFDDLLRVYFVRCIPKNNMRRKNEKVLVVDYDVGTNKLVPAKEVFKKRVKIPIDEQIEEDIGR